MLSKTRSFAGFIVLLITVLCVPALWLQDYAVGKGPAVSEGETVSVRIPAGASLAGIKRILTDKALLKADIRFEVLAVVLGYADSLKAGQYAITAGSSPLEILRRLESGDVISQILTIPEGFTIMQIGRVLEEQYAYSRDRFRELCHDRQLIESLGLEAMTLEGYLFPDTYYLTVGMPLEGLIRKMVRRFREVYDGLSRGAISLYSRHEIITMASIIEKETAIPAERPIVASVLINRLERNMLLQVDPTVMYGLDKLGEGLSTADLIRDTPYNSYLHRGLPPGPICNPGRAAISAALNPAGTSYLYFVARDDGNHKFSRSLREHINAVNRFQRK